MKVWNVREVSEPMDYSSMKVGTIIRVDKDGILVKTLDGSVLIEEVQFSSCRRMCVSDYICGNQMIEGESLGE